MRVFTVLKVTRDFEEVLSLLHISRFVDVKALDLDTNIIF